jgi:hypothetical protein
VGEAVILLTGDPPPDVGQPFLSHDIHALTVAYRGATTDKLHILALMHHDGYSQADWEIYETTAAELATMQNVNPNGATTISQAVTAGKLRLIDFRANDTRGPLYDVATDMGATPAGDRRITLKGGAVEIAAVDGYNRNAPETFVTYERGYGAGKVGGMNVNSFTLTHQAIKDAERGLQFKHTLSGIVPEALRAAAKAEKAAKLAAAKPGLRAISRAAKPVEPEEDKDEEEGKADKK